MRGIGLTYRQVGVVYPLDAYSGVLHTHAHVYKTSMSAEGACALILS